MAGASERLVLCLHVAEALLEVRNGKMAAGSDQEGHGRRRRQWQQGAAAGKKQTGPDRLALLRAPTSHPRSRYRLHVIDLDPSSVTSGGWLEDTSFVDKYTMSDDAYDELGTNIRKFKEKMSDNQMEELCANIKWGFQRSGGMMTKLNSLISHCIR
ncbi:hypothetical protein TRIUR3_27621 [Triticum urartu]|uniref:Uncharacterized protein n=1 Tax=Triticum urartu TaxID=4572 RepID=M7ZP91_TRIUA|nr:hypothetical protein TRIUR3_27621 [Triticum urartu]